MTTKQYSTYMMHGRFTSENVARMPVDAGRMHQAWIVMQYARVELNNLQYQATHQAMFRVESTNGLKFKNGTMFKKYSQQCSSD